MADNVTAQLPILFTHYGDDAIRGSEQVLLDLLSALDRSRFQPILWCNGSALAERARLLGVITYQTPMCYFLSAGAPVFDWAVLRGQIATARAISLRHGVRLLHANSAAPIQWLAPVGRALRLPLLAHLHAPYLRRDRFVLLQHLATLAVGVSRPTLAGLALDGMAPKRLRVIPNGVDPARLLRGSAGDLRRRLGIAADAVVIGCVGSLIGRKGLDVVMAAFARFALSRTAHLILAGSGPEQGALEALAGVLGIAQLVHFLGDTDHPAEVYQAMDVNVLASRQEAFGVVLVEAAICGVPSIGSAVDGIPEVVVDGQTGLLFPRDDVAALAGALEMLGGDAGLRERFGGMARARAFDQFTAARMAESFDAAYGELLALPRSRLGWTALGRAAGPHLRLPVALLRRGGRERVQAAS